MGGNGAGARTAWSSKSQRCEMLSVPLQKRLHLGSEFLAGLGGFCTLFPHISRTLLMGLRKDVLSLDAEMLGGSQQVSVIGIDDREAGLGRRSQVDGIGGAQEHTLRQFSIDMANAVEDLLVLGKPAERASLNVGLNLAE